MQIPYIPEDAPFDSAQRAWITGFIAGMQSRKAPVASDTSATVLNLLFGTQTGNAEMVAEDAATSARAMGMDARVQAMDDVDMAALAAMRRVIVVCSTYGEGEMPDNTQLFWEALSATTAPRLEEMQFGVLALGDTGYDGYCQAGKLLDTRLEQLGARRLTARIDCDVDYEDAAAGWIGATLPLVGGKAAVPVVEKTGWGRKNPYAARLAVNRLLSGQGSSKEIRHYEFDLAESGLTYEAGDALAVMPRNDPALVADIVAQLGSGDAQMLTTGYEIVTPTRDLVAAVEERAGDDELSHILRNNDREALDAWLWGRDTLDLLRMLPAGGIDSETFMGLVKPLQHRAYSISSSPKAHAGSVHLTVASVRYDSFGRSHGGVCSTFLADRADGAAGIFTSANKSFRVPADGFAPMVMVGPGTGIAPFRAFLQERQAMAASGRNWLFFGDQHRATDFIYDDELAGMSRDGLLTRLDLAFSRDQAEKVYVQTRMRENGRELFAWLQEGGHFYVCGDASRMARDVDAALHDIVATHGGMGAEAATDYVNTMKREKRYLRDVY